MFRFTVRTMNEKLVSIQIIEPFSFFAFLSPAETSDRRVPLPGAAGEQQLQHLPLQEVPQHVRGAEADWPVQVWEQNWTGPEGHPVPPNVHRVLSVAPGGGPDAPRCDGNEDGAVRKSLPPRKVTVTLLRLIHPDVFIPRQPRSASALSSGTDSGPPIHHPDAATAPLIVSKGHL